MSQKTKLISGFTILGGSTTAASYAVTEAIKGDEMQKEPELLEVASTKTITTEQKEETETPQPTATNTEAEDMSKYTAGLPNANEYTVVTIESKDEVIIEEDVVEVYAAGEGTY